MSDQKKQMSELEKIMNENKAQAQKSYEASTGEVTSFLKYTGSYIFSAKSLKYVKDDEVKEYPALKPDKFKGIQCPMVLEVAKGHGTKNVPEGTSTYFQFPIISQNPDEKKRMSASNLCKNRLRAFMSKEEVESSQPWDFTWLVNNVLGEYKENEDGSFDIIRPTKLHDLVYIKFEEDTDDKGVPRLKDVSIRKATPEDVSVEGVALGVEDTTNVQVVKTDAKPQFNTKTADDSDVTDSVVDDF